MLLATARASRYNCSSTCSRPFISNRRIPQRANGVVGVACRRDRALLGRRGHLAEADDGHAGMILYFGEAVCSFGAGTRTRGRRGDRLLGLSGHLHGEPGVLPPLGVQLKDVGFGYEQLLSVGIMGSSQELRCSCS